MKDYVCVRTHTHLCACACAMPPADRCLIGSRTEAPEVICCLSRSIKSCGNSVPLHSCSPLHSTSYPILILTPTPTRLPLLLPSLSIVPACRWRLIPGLVALCSPDSSKRVVHTGRTSRSKVDIRRSHTNTHTLHLFVVLCFQPLSSLLTWVLSSLSDVDLIFMVVGIPR